MNPIYRFFIAPDDDLYQYFQAGQILNPNSGAMTANAGFKTSNYIYISNIPEKQFLFDNGYSVSFYRGYDESTFISGRYISGGEIIANIPNGAVYMRVCVTNANETLFEMRPIRQVFPVYKDDLAKDWELETNQRFYRPKLSGKISFIRDDYKYLAGKSFETEFRFLMDKSDDLGVTWNRDFTGKFMKTDCQWNEDDLKCTVQPDVLDEYNDTLAGLEKEYNLLELAPRIVRCQMDKRPLIQVYIPGDSVVSCFTAGTYWEQDANVVTDRNALVRTYHFALCNMLKEMKVTVNGSPTAINGLYVGRMSLSGNNFTGSLYPDTTTGYYITVAMQYLPPWFGIVRCKIIRSSDGAEMFTYEINVGGSGVWDNLDFTMSANTANGATGTATVEMATYNIYVRYLLDVMQIQGLDTYPLPSDDIVENNRNYHRAIGYAIDVGYISNSFTTEPTQWGRADDGNYFVPPYSIWGQEYFPIARSTWRYASVWFGFALFDWILEEQGRKTYTLRDAYPISSAISVLLKQFAPGITHEPTEEYSQFLYARNNPISYAQFTLLVTQKTNILKGEYDQPAQKAPVTLQQITTMLRDCFRAFWYIEDGKFKIEHIQWFRNGGTYGYNQQLTADLTLLTNVRNGKKWGFNSSAWEFEKVDLAERFQFEWMDDVTKNFAGYPIDVISKYVTAGKIETVNVSNFTTDVDYMLMNPGAISDDGFALFAATKRQGNLFNANTVNKGYYVNPSNGQLIYHPTNPAAFNATDYIEISGGYMYFLSYRYYVAFYDANKNYISGNSQAQAWNQTLIAPDNAKYMRCTVTTSELATFYVLEETYKLPYVQRPDTSETYTMQNGLVSWMYLQPTFYPYDLPARRCKINNSEISAYGVERKKKQVVTYPSIDDPDPMKLIKTPIGTGQIDKISITLHSRSNKVTLKYDTDSQ